MQFIKYLGGILSDKVHEDTENSKFLYEDSTYLLQIILYKTLMFFTFCSI